MESVLADQYLERLLAAGDRRASDVPADAGLDPSVRHAAARLRRELPRFHPSFRFEDRLATRLVELAGQLRLPAAAGAEGASAPPPHPRVPFGGVVDPELDGIAAGRLDPSADPVLVPRAMLLRGAVASAALSIAGVAYVAWRASHPPATPMVRAVRAARRVHGRGADRGAGHPPSGAAWRRAARIGRIS